MNENETQTPLEQTSPQHQKDGNEPEKQTAPETEQALTADAVSAMIADAIGKFSRQQAEQQSEAEKLAGMNAQERAEHERDTFRSQLEALQKQIASAEMQKTARSMLAEQNIHLPDALLSTLVAEDAEATKQNVTAFAEMYTKAVEDGIKERLKSGTPKTGTVSKKMTKAEIMAIPDEAKRLEAIRNNLDLF